MALRPGLRSTPREIGDRVAVDLASGVVYEEVAPAATERQRHEQARHQAVAAKEEFQRISLSLVTRYAEDPESLSADEKANVEGWLAQHPHAQDDVDEIRRNAGFYATLTTSLSHI